MSAAEKRLSIDDYFLIEENALYKSEFLDGVMYAMAGGSARHSLIIGNLTYRLKGILRNRPCFVFPTEMRVRCPSGLYTYPDLSITCGKPKFLNDRETTLENPQAIIEVLSDSAEKCDRGRKFEHCRSIESLQAYVLVDQDRMHLDCFLCNDSKSWLLSEAATPGDALWLPFLDLRLPVEEIYRLIDFPVAEELR